MDGDLMNPAEAIAYLRLNAEPGNASEKLRNLCRRQQLPHFKRGRLILFSRSAVDAWLARGARGLKMPSPARLVGNKGLTTKTA